eukprot:5139407-Prymnesium_polylepis.1
MSSTKVTVSAITRHPHASGKGSLVPYSTGGDARFHPSPIRYGAPGKRESRDPHRITQSV